MSVHDFAVVVAILGAFVAGYGTAQLRREPTAQERHDRAVERFREASGIRRTGTLPDMRDVTVVFSEIEFLHLGADAAGTEIVVNAHPFPASTGITIEGTPSGTAVVIVGDAT